MAPAQSNRRADPAPRVRDGQTFLDPAAGLRTDELNSEPEGPVTSSPGFRRPQSRALRDPLARKCTRKAGARPKPGT